MCCREFLLRNRQEVWRLASKPPNTQIFSVGLVLLEIILLTSTTLTSNIVHKIKNRKLLLNHLSLLAAGETCQVPQPQLGPLSTTKGKHIKRGSLRQLVYGTWCLQDAGNPAAARRFWGSGESPQLLVRRLETHRHSLGQPGVAARVVEPQQQAGDQQWHQAQRQKCHCNLVLKSVLFHSRSPTQT